MVNFTHLQSIVRHCLKCGRNLYWSDFIAPLRDEVLYPKTWINKVKKIGLKLLEVIWENPIFVLECCWCYKDIRKEKI